MFYSRYYYCFSCKKNFTLSDGVICHSPIGVTCPHCGSSKTIEKFFK